MAQGNPFDQFDAPKRSGQIYTLPPTAHQQGEDARAAERIAMERARIRMEQDRFARDQQKWHQDNDPVTAPGDTSKTGDDYLATLPPALANQVRMMAEGRMAMPTGSGLRNAQTRMLMAAAAQYDPTMDAANVASRIAARKDFTSGKSAQNITSMNTALGHLGSLWQAAQDLHNRRSPTWNSIANWAETESGDPRVKNFNTRRDAVADELTKVFRGTGGNEADIKRWIDDINSSQSPAQLRGAMSSVVELLNSRLQAMGDQYNRGMGRSSDPIALLNPHAQKVFGALGTGGNGILDDDQKAPPLVGGGQSSGGPGGQGGNGSGGPGMGPTPGPAAPHSFSGGGMPQQLATQGTRDVFDSVTSAGIDALIRAGRPPSEAQAYAKAQGYDNFDMPGYVANMRWFKQHPDYKGNMVNAHRSEPTTAWQRISASPGAAAVVGASNALTAGFNDELAAGTKSLFTGADFDQTLNDLNARKAILAQTHPVADAAGNMAGGAAAMIGGGGLASRFAPNLTQRALGMFGRLAPVASDIAYGTAYGAGQNNDDRLAGAVIGGAAGGAGGMAARAATRGVANVLAPPAGPAAQLYAAGVFPTLGQRFANSGIAGRAVNAAEQAMQSFPLLGSLVAQSRQAARDAFQRSGFNSALGDIGSELPAGSIGTDAHNFASDAFNNAYSHARGGMQFRPDRQYMGDLNQFMGRLNNGSLNEAQAQQVGRTIDNSVGSRLRSSGGVLNGEAYQRAGYELSQIADDWGRDGVSLPMSRAARDYLSIFDSSARRNSTPEAVSALDAADRGYAKLVRLQNASSRGGVRKDAGTFSPADLLSAVKQESGGVRSSAYNRGDALMQQYAEAGRLLGDTLPNSGTTDRLLTGQLLTGGVGTALHAPAAIAGSPASLAPFAAYAPGLDTVFKRLIAPRETTLPPALARPVTATAAQIYDRAPVVGHLAVPGTVEWFLGQ